MMNQTTCCFTGHRKLPEEKTQNILARLDRAIDSLIAGGVTDFISGGALGFDLIAASAMIAKRDAGKNIRLIFALPCKNQAEYWPQSQQTQYYALLRQADEVLYISEKYDSLCMKRRNQYMINHSAHCICALLDEKSGTGQTVRFAREKGLHVINVIT